MALRAAEMNKKKRTGPEQTEPEKMKPRLVSTMRTENKKRNRLDRTGHVL